MPLPVFLRVPLTWFQSSTSAHFPDETHAEIRKVFTPLHQPDTKRHFCGYCGSPLTHWNERTKDNAEWIFVSLGSLENESLNDLSEHGLLPNTLEGDSDERYDSSATTRAEREDGAREIHGQPWFMDMIEGSRLGNLRRRKGARTSADGRSKVEWEVVEFVPAEESTQPGGVGSGKRKVEELVDERAFSTG
ncbi:hypothetical protein MMC25_003284 [Agyrium rufum]|nr:hypothetical protein [Agyrium rufum]